MEVKRGGDWRRLCCASFPLAECRYSWSHIREPWLNITSPPPALWNLKKKTKTFPFRVIFLSMVITLEQTHVTIAPACLCLVPRIFTNLYTKYELRWCDRVRPIPEGNELCTSFLFLSDTIANFSICWIGPRSRTFPFRSGSELCCCTLGRSDLLC